MPRKALELAGGMPEEHFQQLEEDEAVKGLWAAVLKKAIKDIRLIQRYRRQDELTKNEQKRLKRVLEDGGLSPIDWIGRDDTGFEEICRVLTLQPARVRRQLNGL